MMAEGGYHTLGKAESAEFIERKSRFIGYAAPLASEEEALQYIKGIRESHKTATHNCYAYIIGANAGLMRYQDDGEPQGTAGIPILEVLKKNNLVNCACVVTRYFGGILLGAGGLTRAYTQGAALAVKAAGIVLAQPSRTLYLSLAYPYLDAAQYALSKLPVGEVEKEFTDKVRLAMIVRESDLAMVEKELTNLTDGTGVIALSDPFYHLWPTEAENDT